MEIRRNGSIVASATAIVLVSSIFVLGIGHSQQLAFASESNSKRYNDGYGNGFDWYANHPNDGANNCDPDKLYTSDGTHTDTYCNGWANGYTAASYSTNNNGNANTGNQQSASSDIHGNNNRVTINQGQSQSSGNTFSPDNQGGQNPGGSNPTCRIVCIS